MRIDFNVLWVEDQPHNVQEQRERIEMLLKDEGFRLRTEFAPSVEKAQQFIGNEIYGDHIDLVLMDKDLGVGKSGEEGLVEVRRKFPYKDIVFYSADTSELRKLVAAKNLDGVFCSNRTRLPDVVNGIFQALVKKVVDIDHSRGIVMGASSEIDHHISECLTHVFSSAGEEGQKTILKLIHEKIESIEKNFSDSVNEAKGLKHVSDLSKYHGVYTSVHRLVLLRKVLSPRNTFVDQCEIMAKYERDSIPVRNKLAHVRVRKDGFSRKLVDSKGEEITRDDMKGLLRGLLECQEMFEHLETLLKVDQSK